MGPLLGHIFFNTLLVTHCFSIKLFYVILLTLSIISSSRNPLTTKILIHERSLSRSWKLQEMYKIHFTGWWRQRCQSPKRRVLHKWLVIREYFLQHRIFYIPIHVCNLRHLKSTEINISTLFLWNHSWSAEAPLYNKNIKCHRSQFYQIIVESKQR